MAAFGDLGDTRRAVEERYGDPSKDRKTRTAKVPGVELIEFNMGFISDSGKYVRVWLKDERSVMESHIARSGFAENEINALIDRNIKKPDWRRVPVGKEMVGQRNQIWIRKDGSIAAFLIRSPNPGLTGLGWLTTSFTVGQVDVLKAEVNQGEWVGDANVTRVLWSILEDVLNSEARASAVAP
jgi:hypothetical protein